MKSKEKKILFLISIISLYLFTSIFFIPADSDVQLFYYYSYLTKNLNLLPYKDFFVVYPPVSLLPILIPGLFSTSFNSYKILFQFEMIIFWIISLCFLYKIIKKIFPEKEIFNKILIFSTLSAFSIFFILNRIDIFIMALILASINFLFENKYLLSSLFLSLSIFTKFYPVIFLPLFLLYLFKNYEVKKTVIFSVYLFLISIFLLISFFIIFPAKNSGAYSFFYHFKRPLHIESLYGGLLLLLEKTKVPLFQITIKHDNYGWSLYNSALLKIILPISSFLILLVFAFLILEILKKKKFAEEDFLKFILIFSLFFIILNKVFSPQYLIWILPFIPLFSDENKIKIFSLIIILTFLTYPIFYPFLIEKNLFLILILNLRNFLFLYLTFFFVKGIFITPNKKIAKKKIPQKPSQNSEKF